MQHCYSKRRSHEKACAGGEFWDVISVLTQDLTKARNQLARLMKEVKPGGGRLYGGDCGWRPLLQPIHRNYTPPATRAGSNLPPNCHRTPPPGHFMCGKQYPLSVYGANPFGRRQPSPRPRQRAPQFSCGKPRKRAPWSFDQPQPEIAPYSCYEKPQPVNYRCEREDKCEMGSNCIKIYINPRRRQHRSSSDICTDGGSGPARLKGGGKRPNCLGTQFATLLQDVTCRLRERRLNAETVDAELSSRTSCP
jgi:hypothetical protein